LFGRGLQPEKQTDTKQEAKRLSYPKQLSFVAVLLKENSVAGISRKIAISAALQLIKLSRFSAEGDTSMERKRVKKFYILFFSAILLPFS